MGRPLGDRRERLEKERWGQKTSDSSKDRDVSEAPTTTTLLLITVCGEEKEERQLYLYNVPLHFYSLCMPYVSVRTFGSRLSFLLKW